MSFVIIRGRDEATLPPRPARETFPPLLTSLVLSSPGGSVDVTERPWRTRAGVRGLTAPTRRPDVADLPGVDGVVRRRARGRSFLADAREIELPLLVGLDRSVNSPEDASGEVSRLEDVLDEDVWREEGELRLTGTRADGSVRWIRVDHVPVAGDLDPLAWWQKTWMPTVRLLAADPWFRSTATPITWGLPSGVGAFLPFLPVRVGSSTVIGNANPVRVLGDKPAWPTITVTGPANSVTASRGDGDSWTLTPPGPLGPGDRVVVRHDPLVGIVDDYETVEGPAGQPWYRYLNAGSLLWALRPGVEDVQVVVPGATAETTVQIAWDHRYRSLL